MTHQQKSVYILFFIIFLIVLIGYLLQPESEYKEAATVGLIISSFFIIGLFSRGAKKQLEARGGKSRADSRNEKLYANPDLNTRKWNIHQSRLNKFGRSQYKGTMFYVGPKGGVYYITYRGTKVYC